MKEHEYTDTCFYSVRDSPVLKRAKGTLPAVKDLLLKNDMPTRLSRRRQVGGYTQVHRKGFGKLVKASIENHYIGHSFL